MLLGFPREIGLRRRPCDSRADFDDYISRINGKASIYTSLFSFERRHPTKAWKFDPESVVMDRAWWDFDTTEDTTLEDVKKDVHTLLTKLNGDIRLVFTGRGFHVHQIFTKPVKGTAIAKHINRYQTEMGRGLMTLDGVGNPQKLTRVPDTYNVTRKKWAVNVDAKAFFENPQEYSIPEKPDASLHKLDPFRGERRNSDFNILTWIAENPVRETLMNPPAKFTGDIGSATEVPLPPCLERAIQEENPRHDVRVALATHMADSLRWFAPASSVSYEDKQVIIDEITDCMGTLGWRDYNRATTRFHVSTLVDYENIPSAEWYRARNLCTGPCWLHD